MNSDAIARMDAFLAEEYHRSEAARRAGNIGSAWHHLERAHIVAQVRLDRTAAPICGCFGLPGDCRTGGRFEARSSGLSSPPWAMSRAGSRLETTVVRM